MCNNLSSEYVLSSQPLIANYIVTLLEMKSSISNNVSRKMFLPQIKKKCLQIFYYY